MLDFFNGKKVLITGHSGFKGSWMCKMLIMAGADVTGYSLNNSMTQSLFEIIDLKNKMNSIIGDIRDLNHLINVFKDVEPEIVIHMAAQPIVRDSYKNPVYTYDTNVMGTVNVCDAIRRTESVKSFVNVTTDKVYLNKEWSWGYREYEELNGYDPYSNSKSCSELVTSSFLKSFWENRDIAVSTCRAGNVIGGGDFANDRIVPDCIKAIMNKKKIIVRNPNSVRPYQHVIEPVMAYLLIAEKQYEKKSICGAYNIGPNDSDCVTTGKLVDLFCEKWNAKCNNFSEASWINNNEEGPHEANFLKLDCSKMQSTFEWKPKWNIDLTIEKTVEWYYSYINNENLDRLMDFQIIDYIRSV